MGKGICGMTLEEALDELERLLWESGKEGYERRQKLYTHVLELIELQTGGDG